MSLRSILRPVLVLAALTAGVAGIAGSADAQGIPLPIPGTGGAPTIPGLPPGVPGGPAPTIPGIPTIPAPGGLPGLPGIPGLPPNLKLFSPSGALLMPVMKDEAKKIFEKLKSALPSAKQTVVADIPLLSDPSKDDVNAFAGCDDSGKTFVVVTEGLYQMIDLIAQTKATDETFGTSYYDEYVKDLAAHQESGAAILPLPPGMLDVTKSLDSRKLQRQRQIFDEEIGYVIGHELGHHYLGHLGSSCSGGGGGVIKPGDIVNVLKKVAPVFNQPNEIAADMAGIENLLDAGQNESDYHWSEGGGLTVIDFFKKMGDLHPGSVLFTFMSTHPAPEIRGPIVKNTANWWRLRHPGAVTGNGNGGGAGTELPKISWPFPIPGAPKP